MGKKHRKAIATTQKTRKTEHNWRRPRILCGAAKLHLVWSSALFWFLLCQLCRSGPIGDDDASKNMSIFLKEDEHRPNLPCHWCQFDDDSIRNSLVKIPWRLYAHSETFGQPHNRTTQPMEWVRCVGAVMVCVRSLAYQCMAASSCFDDGNNGRKRVTARQSEYER